MLVKRDYNPRLKRPVLKYVNQQIARGYRDITRKSIYTIMEQLFNWQKKCGRAITKQFMQDIAEAVGGRYDTSKWGHYKIVLD